MFGKKAPPLAALAAMASWALLAPLAQAEPITASDVIQIKAGDIDLNTKAGAKEMLVRVDAAATQACWPDKLSEMDKFKACRDGVILNAVQVLNRPTVSLVYAETYPTQKARPMMVASR